MKKHYRSLSVLLTAGMMAGALAGCGQSARMTETATSPAASESPATSSSPAYYRDAQAEEACSDEPNMSRIPFPFELFKGSEQASSA